MIFFLPFWESYKLTRKNPNMVELIVVILYQEFFRLKPVSRLGNQEKGLKPLTIFTEKLHLRCFTRFCLRLCSEVTSSIYQTHKFKVYCNSFWRQCNVFDVVFSRIKETLCPFSDVTSKNLELLCDCMFATNTKTIIYIT